MGTRGGGGSPALPPHSLFKAVKKTWYQPTGGGYIAQHVELVHKTLNDAQGGSHTHKGHAVLVVTTDNSGQDVVSRIALKERSPWEPRNEGEHKSKVGGKGRRRQRECWS